jgi:hypothetical protein
MNIVALKVRGRSNHVVSGTDKGRRDALEERHFKSGTSRAMRDPPSVEV